ncbi:MAG: hypothetical protein JSU04_19455 [Bdellovibrionales bacterium]|nr:hypothetical protein [Bdellovibrionales bacterium]
MLLYLTTGNKMQIHRFRLLLLALICFFLSRVVFASSVVQTEFEMLLPRSFQQDLIEKEWDTLQKQEFKLNWALPDQTFDTPDVKVFMTGLKLDLNTRLQKPNIGGSGETVLLESRGLESNLFIQSVAIDQYIERDIGGVIGRFRVQAKCEGVNLHLKPGKATLTMQLSPVFDGAILRAQVDDANLTWTPDAWEITAMKCSGAEGFEDIVRDEIHQRTGDASIVTSQKATLMQYVRDYVGSHSLDLSKPRSLITARPDIKVSMSVTDFSGTEKNAVVHGLFRVEFTRLKSNDQKNLRLSKDSLGSNSSPVIRVPEDFVLEVAKQAYAGNTWSEKVYSTDIPGFQTLMKSRFTQFFVWRELMDYPKSAKFLFEVYSPKNISISGAHLSYDVKAPLYAKMYAPRAGESVPFMNFSVPLTSNVKLSLNDGKIAAKFTDVTLGLQESWDPSYVAKYSPSKTFATETIRKRIQSAAQGASLNYTLPSIPVADDVSLLVQKVQSTKDGDLVLYLKMPSSGPTPK